ncbi:MAG: S8 family serine peptidase [Anaerolineae bacterium]|nr:S8 family serine peptidase [Anaerolineae bacterium]
METSLQDQQNIEQPQPEQPHGCLTAFLAAIIFGLVGLMGLMWIGAMLLGDVFGRSLVVNLGYAGVYALILIVPFASIAVFLKQERFALWRGIALMLALAGGHNGLIGLSTAAEQALMEPGLPNWLPSLLSILYSLAIIAAGRKRFLGKPAAGPLLLGIALGLIVPAGWLVIGALGTLVETSLSLFDAFSVALICAVLLASIFFYNQEMLTRKPIWSAVLVGGAFFAIQYGVLTVRGYWLQSAMLTTGMLLCGFVAGALLTLDERPDLPRLWWAVLAFLFAAFLLPFTLADAVEGEFMLDEMGAAWGPTIPAGLLLGLLLGTSMLFAHRWLVKIVKRPAIPAIFDVGALAVCAALYAGFGQPEMQPETFFVVMADQADTAFANDITDRNERVSAVYETLTEHAQTSQADLRDMLDAQGIEYTPYYLINGIEVVGDPILRLQIAARPDVARILNTPYARPLPSFVEPKSMSATTDLLEGLPWGIDKMDAELVWEQFGITGEGIIVGGADSGVDWTHPALHSRYLGSEGNHDYTWFDPWAGAGEPVDEMGHGTHTLGTVLGQGGIGVAPGAQWIACRNLGRNLGNPAYYLDCMQFLFAPYPQDGDPFTDGDPARGAHVVNNSWGCPPEEGCDAITLPVAITHLRNAGQMYVVSAGNEGPTCNTVGPPANADAAFSVGAIFEDGSIVFFSSRGPVLVDGSGRIKPDVVAPGWNTLSSVPGDGYGYGSGTSMAGPHVAGLVALLWSADPSLIGDIDRTEQIIESTAHYVSASDLCGGDNGEVNNIYGYGWVDAFAAVRKALVQLGISSSPD